MIDWRRSSHRRGMLNVFFGVVRYPRNMIFSFVHGLNFGGYDDSLEIDMESSIRQTPVRISVGSTETTRIMSSVAGKNILRSCAFCVHALKIICSCSGMRGLLC